CLSQKGREATANSKGGQVYAFFEELASRGLGGPALVGVRPRHADRAAVHNGVSVAADGVAVVEGHQATGGVAAGPEENLDRRNRAAGREIAHQQNIAAPVGSREGMAAVGGNVRVLADRVLEEPKAGR